MDLFCEAFPGRLPSEIWAETQRLPAGYLARLLEVRAYRKAKGMVDAVDGEEAEKRLPRTPLIRLVKAITEELMLEEMGRDV